MEKLTDLDRAAVVFHVYGGCNDKKLLFTIAEGETRVKRLKDSSLNVTALNWFKSHKIQSAINYYKNVQKMEQDEIIKKAFAEREKESVNKEVDLTLKDETNFLNLDEFLQYANIQANKIKDEKEKRAWVEMIGKYMNFKETEEGETDIMRFYTPVFCDVCELKKRCSACKFEVCPIETL